MRTIPKPPAKTPFVDDKGMMTREWILYFQAYSEALKELQEAVLVLQGGP